MGAIVFPAPLSDRRAVERVRSSTQILFFTQLIPELVRDPISCQFILSCHSAGDPPRNDEMCWSQMLCVPFPGRCGRLWGGDPEPGRAGQVVGMGQLELRGQVGGHRAIGAAGLALCSRDQPTRLPPASAPPREGRSEAGRGSQSHSSAPESRSRTPVFPSAHTPAPRSFWERALTEEHLPL